jgi:thiosulfate reductase cytochrome b subunit
MTRVYVFKRFERFWHWSQAALIMFMLLTGFEVHGNYALFGWEKAAGLHTTTAWLLIGLWVFAIFWHFTTGEWRQYIPTTEKLVAQARYYAFGIFAGAPHPFRATELRKHNPLQRLAYLAIKLVVNPLIWGSGLVYLYWHAVTSSGIPGLAGLPLGWVALVHTAAAFMMLIFLTVHVYFATTGHTPVAHIKAMITGWEELDEEPQAETSKGA